MTAAGCNARCPELRVPCVGCRGPMRDSNAAALQDLFAERGFDKQTIAARLRTFAPLGGF
jgi:coenzyme F420-reducing hydrogenase gamma subunit